MTKAERIRRTAKRTKPDAVELLRREIARAEKQAAEFGARAKSATPWKFWHGRNAGMSAAYVVFSDRLQRIVNTLTEEK